MARTLIACLLAGIAFASSATAGSVVGIGEQSGGTTIRLHRGDILAVSLGANASTGYAWRLVSVGRKVLKPDTATYIRLKVTPGIVGSGGVSVHTFTAAARGRTTLRLAYVGPGRSPPTAKRFSVRVVVR